MLDLVRSKQALAMATVAAALWALGSAFDGLSSAIIAPQNLTASNNLTIAGAWIVFASGFVALSATCHVTWNLFVTRRWSQAWEAGGAVVSTLVLAIGLLVAATQATDVSGTADVVTGIGFGGWGVLLVVGAARRALSEQETPGMPRQAGLWLAAAAAVVVVAISIGLPTPSLNDATLAVLTGALEAVGFAGLVLVLSVARSRRFIFTKQFRLLAAALWGLTIWGVAGAVSSGIVFGPLPRSVLSIRVGLSTPSFVAAAALSVLAWAALRGVGDLVTGERPVASGTAPPGWHADPVRGHELRWWDGVRWTDHVLDGGQLSTDRL